MFRLLFMQSWKFWMIGVDYGYSYTYSPIYAYCYILMLKEGEHVK